MADKVVSERVNAILQAMKDMPQHESSSSSASFSGDSLVYNRKGKRVVMQLRTGRIYIDGKRSRWLEWKNKVLERY